MSNKTACGCSSDKWANLRVLVEIGVTILVAGPGSVVFMVATTAKFIC